VALEMMIEAKLNGAPFWRKQWIRHWPDGEKDD
jgi:hypothetical protein